jgi:hypothetical protein
MHVRAVCGVPIDHPSANAHVCARAWLQWLAALGGWHAGPGHRSIQRRTFDRPINIDMHVRDGDGRAYVNLAIIQDTYVLRPL